MRSARGQQRRRRFLRRGEKRQEVLDAVLREQPSDGSGWADDGECAVFPSQEGASAQYQAKTAAIHELELVEVEARTPRRFRGWRRRGPTPGRARRRYRPRRGRRPPAHSAAGPRPPRTVAARESSSDGVVCRHKREHMVESAQHGSPCRPEPWVRRASAGIRRAASAGGARPACADPWSRGTRGRADRAPGARHPRFHPARRAAARRWQGRVRRGAARSRRRRVAARRQRTAAGEAVRPPQPSVRADDPT